MNQNVHVITTWPEAKKVFLTLTDDVTIYDTWDFRHTFAQYENIDPYFLVYGDPESPRALLPLEFNHKKNVYESFGTYYIEQNHIYGEQNSEITEAILASIPKPVHLEGLNELNSPNPFISPADPKYILSTQQYTNFEDYLSSKITNGETRGKMRRKFINTEKINALTINPGEIADLEAMFRLNKQMFGIDSSFNDPNREKIFRDLVKIFTPDIITIKSGNEIMGVSCAVLYKEFYVRLNSGNLPGINNLGNYLHYASIKRAIELHKTFDAMSGSYHWKEDYHLDTIPQFSFKNI